LTRPAIGLVLAGGQGTRMEASHPGPPKPLVRVGGITLLELGLARLADAGVTEVHLALRHRAAEVLAAAQEAAAGRGLTLIPHQEEQPLGTIGAAFHLRGRDATVLAVNGDLVSAIDLGAFLARHRERRADLSIATHDEHVRLKLGEVVADGEGRVIDYREKPVKTFRISSGTYALEPAVVALVQRNTWTSIPDLVRRAVQSSALVVEDPHDAPWIDVNDALDLAAAEALVADDPRAFGIASAEGA